MSFFFAVSRRKGLIFVSKELAQTSRTTSSVWWCLTISLNYLSRIALQSHRILTDPSIWNFLDDRYRLEHTAHPCQLSLWLWMKWKCNSSKSWTLPITIMWKFLRTNKNRHSPRKANRGCQCQCQWKKKACIWLSLFFSFLIWGRTI